MKKFKLVLWFVFFIAVSLFIGSNLKTRVVYQKEQVILDNLTKKINQLKGEMLRDLKQCESAGITEENGLVTFDPHPTKKQVQIPSFGSYQEKKSFIQYYYKTLYNKDITGKEAILIALDDEKAGELASDVIFKTDKGLSNWYNCSKKHNLESRLNIIKELEK